VSRVRNTCPAWGGGGASWRRAAGGDGGTVCPTSSREDALTRHRQNANIALAAHLFSISPWQLADVPFGNSRSQPLIPVPFFSERRLIEPGSCKYRSGHHTGPALIPALIARRTSAYISCRPDLPALDHVTVSSETTKRSVKPPSTPGHHKRAKLGEPFVAQATLNNRPI